MPTPTTAPARNGGSRGVTLLEIIIAMLVIGMVAAGIMSAFVFSRRVSLFAGNELSGAGLARQSVDDLRMAINGNTPGGLSLAPGVYVDQNMVSPPTLGGFAPVRVPALNFPAEFLRFQTNEGRVPAPTLADHGDGRLVVVEGVNQDLDVDGLSGFDFDRDGATDLRRVRVRVRWSTPQS